MLNYTPMPTPDAGAEIVLFKGMLCLLQNAAADIQGTAAPGHNSSWRPLNILRTDSLCASLSLAGKATVMVTYMSPDLSGWSNRGMPSFSIRNTCPQQPCSHPQQVRPDIA